MMSPVTSSTARRATATARSAPGGEGINRHGTADWGDASSAAANTERPDRYYNYRYGIIIIIMITVAGTGEALWASTLREGFPRRRRGL